MKVLTCVLSVCFFLVGYAEASVVYTNDFGTDGQIYEFQWKSNYGDLSNLKTDGDGSGPIDYDGDSLTRVLVADTGYGCFEGVRAVCAPLYHKMSNFSLSAYGRGDNANWATRASWGISYDGEDWTHNIQTDDSNVLKMYSLSVDPSDDRYSGLSKVFISTKLENACGVYSAGNSARTAAIKFECDVEPANIGDRVFVYSNDFGTQQQRDQWLWSGYIAFSDGEAVDSDSDGKSAVVSCSSASTSYGIVRIDAPVGFSFKEPKVVAQGYTSVTANGSWAYLKFSLDGSSWDHRSELFDATGWHDLEVDTSGDSNYQQIETLWLKVEFYNWNNVNLPEIKNILVSAELAPALAHVCGEDGTLYLEGDISGPAGNPDCYVDIYDFGCLASQWLECNGSTGNCAP